MNGNSSTTLAQCNERKLALSIFFEDYIKVARVNVLTGEYKFIKCFHKTEFDDENSTGKLKDYLKRTVEEGQLHPDDAKIYLRFLDMEYLRDKLTGGKRIIMHGVRVKLADVYVWTTVEIIAPEEFSEEYPWALLCLRETERELGDAEENVRLLVKDYHNIAKVNLTNDTYEIVKAYDSAIGLPESFSSAFSVWLSGFLAQGYVYDESTDGNKFITDIGSLRSYFHGRRCLRYRYHKDTNSSMHQIMVEFTPDIEYTDENQIVMLNIRDIGTASDEQSKMILEHYGNRDIFTGLWNKFHYYSACKDYINSMFKESVGVILAEISGEKSGVGDREYIQPFAWVLTDEFGKNVCYHLGEGKLMVLFIGENKNRFIRRAEQLKNRMAQMSKRDVVIGYAWEEYPETIESVVRCAEEESGLVQAE